MARPSLTREWNPAAVQLCMATKKSGEVVVSSREQALANLKWTRETCERWVPAHLKERAPVRSIPAAAAGKVFWGVMMNLTGHSRRAARGGK